MGPTQSLTNLAGDLRRGCQDRKLGFLNQPRGRGPRLIPIPAEVPGLPLVNLEGREYVLEAGSAAAMVKKTSDAVGLTFDDENHGFAPFFTPEI